ncbi:PAS domain-containing protein [Blastococcus capsensis]|uniref:PAS domain-containing protein n=1 Tax=Blastococcus capsensis TaxID=1564163 RepID=UPI002540AA9E|nr:PAS domain-containing protein [Blastococcus capsensis]MDK3257534.1 PAS domain-containing protein [Blastococcus capsensis]
MVPAGRRPTPKGRVRSVDRPSATGAAPRGAGGPRPARRRRRSPSTSRSTTRSHAGCRARPARWRSVVLDRDGRPTTGSWPAGRGGGSRSSIRQCSQPRAAGSCAGRRAGACPYDRPVSGRRPVSPLSEEFVTPRRRGRCRRRVERAIATHGAYDTEYRVVLADGRHRWVAARGRVVGGEEGNPARLIGVAHDTTARWRSSRVRTSTNCAISCWPACCPPRWTTTSR